MSDVRERLRRLLFLVPYVSKHPGIGVDALSAALGISREALLEELDLLALVGRPPFQPDDCIDIYVENDQVFVDLDQRMSAPPRLTAAEAAALAAAGELFEGAASQTLSSAKAKLERVLPPGTRVRFREMEQKIDARLDAPRELGPLTEAVSRHLEVEFDYFSQDRAAAEHRVVQPSELLSHRGQWYLFGFCKSRQDDRLFRIDRLQNVRLTQRSFEPRPEGMRRPFPNPAGERADQVPVRVRFSPLAAPYIREQFGAEARPSPEGGVEVRVTGESPRWLAQWVLSFGGEAEVLEPESAREAVARVAVASLES